jgi:hypothetical protein
MKMSEYYPDYKPTNEQHFNNMVNQFRKAPDKELMNDLVILWMFDMTVDRQDIVVALGRVEKERGWTK